MAEPHDTIRALIDDHNKGTLVSLPFEAMVDLQARVAALEKALKQGIAGLSVIPLPHAEHVAARMLRALAPKEAPE